MPPPKKSLSFSDLGLEVPLPSVLSKSRSERKNELLEAKKVKKERQREAIEVVSASHELILKRKREIEEEMASARSESERRKKASQIEHLRSRKLREQKEAEEKQRILAGQSRIIAKLQENWKEDEKKQKEIEELFEREREQAAQLQPPNVHIDIQRTEDILRQRADLPVLREEQPIIEAINSASRSCVLVSGETGSGKTTQIPQFLWEAGYGHPEGAVFGREGCILVTEPRRVAAVSMAKRVAEELNVIFGNEVCYHVRYDNNLSNDCRIKFATEGVILKEIQSDFLLKRYSVVLVDEAHERSLSCDILVGLLSRIVPLRNDLFLEQLRSAEGDITKVDVKPLKLVIMSATLHIADFRDNRKLFPIPPPLIQVDSRRYPVSIHFSRKTVLKEYVEEAFKKVRQIHKKLPPGGILVFLTTQQEIEDLCSRLRSHYKKNKVEYSSVSYNKHAMLLGREKEEVANSSDDDASTKNTEAEPVERDEYGLQANDYSLADEVENNGDGGSKKVESLESLLTEEHPRHKGTSLNALDPMESVPLEEDLGDDEVNGEYNTLHILPLYALLDFQKQQEVFKEPPFGKRLCVVATNVAETSLTIPNIKYVVDTGRAKVKVMEKATKASSYRIDWISQASAEQRAGRAGRMGPGHCYRLFSTAVYANLMPKNTTPEIMRSPLDSVVLLMKHIGIQHVSSFPFPSLPDETELKAALAHLAIIGALDASKNYRITSLGRCLVSLPLPPRFARAVEEAKKLSPRILEMTCAIAAVVSTMTTLFTGEGNRIKALKMESCKDDPQAQSIKALLSAGSDLITFLNGFAVYCVKPQKCWYYCMVQKSMQEAKLLFHQLYSMVLKSKENTGNHLTSHTAADDEDVTAIDDVEGQTEEGKREGSCFFGPSPFAVNRDEELLLRRIFISGLLDHVARRATVLECRFMGIPYVDKSTGKAPYIISSTGTIAYVHPTSSVAKTIPPAEYLTFSYLQKVHRSERREAQTMLLGASIVTRAWLDDYGYKEE